MEDTPAERTDASHALARAPAPVDGLADEDGAPLESCVSTLSGAQRSLLPRWCLTTATVGYALALGRVVVASGGLLADDLRRAMTAEADAVAVDCELVESDTAGVMMNVWRGCECAPLVCGNNVGGNGSGAATCEEMEHIPAPESCSEPLRSDAIGNAAFTAIREPRPAEREYE